MADPVLKTDDRSEETLQGAELNEEAPEAFLNWAEAREHFSNLEYADSLLFLE